MTFPTNPRKWVEMNTRDHETTIIRDDGNYRHIRFKQPGTSIWWFDLVTWPGHLVITGDLQDYHFARTDDMFDFFRRNGYADGINPDYWGEKLRGPGNHTHRVFSPDRFKRHVYEYFREWCACNDGPHAPLWHAIRQEVLTDEYGEVGDENRAHQLLTEFQFTVYPPGSRSTTFEFTDSWEWDLRDHDWHYLISCHAIVWGITQYDRARARAQTAVPA